MERICHTDGRLIKDETLGGVQGQGNLEKNALEIQEGEGISFNNFHPKIK